MGAARLSSELVGQTYKERVRLQSMAHRHLVDCAGKKIVRRSAKIGKSVFRPPQPISKQLAFNTAAHGPTASGGRHGFTVRRNAPRIGATIARRGHVLRLPYDPTGRPSGPKVPGIPPRVWLLSAQARSPSTPATHEGENCQL